MSWEEWVSTYFGKVVWMIGESVVRWAFGKEVPKAEQNKE